MAATTLAPPTSPVGPCANACTHRDCRETRAMAATACAYCGKPIGYDVRFYQLRRAGLVHAACHEDACAANPATAKE